MLADVAQSHCETAARKRTLEAGPADVERVPARVDDLRVGQNQMDEADVAEISGHLVGEERPSEFATRLDQAEIILTQAAKAVDIDVLQHLGKRAALFPRGRFGR